MEYDKRVEDEEDDDDEGPMWWRKVKKHLNFFRIHVMYYIFTPLIFSGIFYASNGRYHIPYIDALFNCVSAMTVCGLTTVNMSMLTGWQQTILFMLMCLGNPILVSWVVVLQRRHFFAIKFKHVLKVNAEKLAAEALASSDSKGVSTWTRVSTLLRPGRAEHFDHVIDASHHNGSGELKEKEKEKGIMQRLRPDMIRRMDDEPKRINPSGHAVSLKKTPTLHNANPGHLSFAPSPSGHDASGNIIEIEGEDQRAKIRRLSDPGTPSRPPTPVETNFPRSGTMQPQAIPLPLRSPDFQQSFPRTQTIEFAPSVARRRNRMTAGMAEEDIDEDEGSHPELEQPFADHRSMYSRRVSLSRQPSMNAKAARAPQSYKHREFGGFPMPWEIVGNLFSRLFPKLRTRVTRTVTIPAATSLVTHQNTIPPGGKAVPYISFNAVVGRNSAFQHLTHEEMEELGGVEYRALNALLWIIGGYHIIIQLIPFIIIAPYISMPKWRTNFVPPAEIRPQNTVWFSLFQSVSAYTNTGMSLVDHSMVPFQTAYPMVIFMCFLILAGNTAFPVFLRFTIWVLTKCVPKTSRANETLHFLLDHPRRCFIFLFPSHQTWFLLTVVFGLTLTDWFFFLVLDIGNPETEAIPLGRRFLVGLFQGIAVRSAGFSAVSVSGLAAAVKVLYVVMMYISVYPIAMSVRSTNVYEEQSLGIFPEDDETDEVDFEPTGHRMTVWSRYLAMHARKQLAFDMWWLGVALFIVCINERHNLDDPTSAEWFNIFSAVFDIVSAYGTVGLSLGTPNNNFSFAGELKSFSKFILCLVMIRGRHRILPVAIDRAVMLPSDLQRQLDQHSDNRSLRRSASHIPQDERYDAHSHRRHSTIHSYADGRPDIQENGGEHLPQ
ncbi:hypothetical protein DXG01_004982 [Tephrocybe rancida]|nr:hypothetical protein DXG01_004982 [Tephrocybe rancida]